MKKLYLFAALATMLAACSENDLTVNEQPSKATETIEDAVNFDVYIGRGLTRGGVNGPVTTDLIKGNPDDGNDFQKAGFGVFGYYTDGEPYSAITKPNFFYNQQVFYNTAVTPKRWVYSPIKYWPNEFGGDAKSDQVDRLTLFAYLPWVDVDPLTGVTKPAGSGATDKEMKAKDPTTNITGMTRNTATGDPFIKYVATMDPTNSVDLCYGVAADLFTSSNSSVNQNKIEKGKPYIDVVKPGTDANSKIKFDFKHATAQLKVTIDAIVKDLTGIDEQMDKSYTRIWVRSVTFTGITQKGSLNLNSTAESPEWYDMNGSSKITTGSLTVYDGRKDGKEANDAASNETPATLNHIIVQSKPYSLDKENKNVIKTGTGEPEAGVTETTVNLFETPSTIAPVFVIPTKEKMRVTIVYDVETVDPNLPYYLSDGKTPGTSVQNTIYKDIDTFGEITAGYCYTLNLHLGMRSVDFDAVVTEWQDKQADIDLPSNLQAYALGSEYNVTLPAGDASYTYEFAITGLEANEAVTRTSPGTPETWCTPASTVNPANGAGIATQTLTIANNTSTQNRTNASRYVWKGNTTGTSVYLNIKQLGCALGLKAPTTFAATGFTVTADAATGLSTDLTINATNVKVYKNGVELTLGTDFSIASGGAITLSTAEAKAAIGDIYKVYIKSGDAPAESVTFTVTSLT